MKGRQIIYSPSELHWIEARKTEPRRALHAAFVAEWGREDVSFDNFKALCTRKGWKTGRTGCFPKGSIPPNKGRKGVCAPGSEKGWFKKGSLSGRAAKVAKPIGTERVAKGGYLQRKVNNDMPFQRRWKMVHILNWEAVNGPMPDGHALKCRDGNRQNTAADNWELVPRAILPRLAGAKKGISYDHAAPELRPSLMATARLEHAIRGRR